MKAQGFSLIELVIVIAVMGVMAGAVVIFMQPAIQAYFDVQRRVDLTDMADNALRRMAKDIRSAVPNSVRSISAGCFQLVPTRSGGRFRGAADIHHDAPPLPCEASASCSAPLDVTQATTVFDVLSPMEIVPARNDWIVVGNQTTDDVYVGRNRAQVVSATRPRASDGRHRITIVATQFPAGYDGGRFVVVPGAESTLIYSCIGDTLYRKASVDFARADLGACNAAADGAVVATDVAACTFVHSPIRGATQQGGFVWMRLELSRAGEGVALAYGVHVDNVP